MGTFTALVNRFARPPFLSDKDLKKKTRGSAEVLMGMLLWSNGLIISQPTYHLILLVKEKRYENMKKAIHSAAEEVIGGEPTKNIGKEPIRLNDKIKILIQEKSEDY
ncbi:hypothetical protein HHI36_007686 [Cryptolaemus montrouzieri]|uniref:Uncharacterized protein n=1 Tax=Cryptolaemus montrouzieri TaxID=559131 RepID=A0ABD2MQ92_9CUCU